MEVKVNNVGWIGKLAAAYRFQRVIISNIQVPDDGGILIIGLGWNLLYPALFGGLQCITGFLY